MAWHARCGGGENERGWLPKIKSLTPQAAVVPFAAQPSSDMRGRFMAADAGPGLLCHRSVAKGTAWGFLLVQA